MQTKTLLLIDDEEIASYVHTHVIKKLHYFQEIQIALSAASAIEQLSAAINSQEAAPDLILLDINMPVASGFDFLDLYAKLPADFIKDTKIIMLSSSTDSRDRQQAVDHPLITGFYNKPLTLESIQKMLVQVFPDDQDLIALK